MLAASTRAFAVRRGIVQTSRVALAPRACEFATSAKDRPVSPHVMIYSFPLAAISSITTRITGGLLAVGVYGIGIGTLVGADMPSLMAALGSSSIGPLAKFSVAFPLSYHYIAAIRHVYWEKFPEGLNPESQKSSSIAIYAASGVLSALAMVL